jgi:hypothetical protein
MKRSSTKMWTLLCRNICDVGQQDWALEHGWHLWPLCSHAVMTCSTFVESVVGFQFKLAALDMNFLEPCTSALWCHIIEDYDWCRTHNRLSQGTLRSQLQMSVACAWWQGWVFLEDSQRSLVWKIRLESFTADRILLDHDGFWPLWRSVQSPCCSLPQWRWKRRYRPVPLRRSAVEKTREYELNWAVEPGVCVWIEYSTCTAPW